LGLIINYVRQLVILKGFKVWLKKVIFLNMENWMRRINY